MQQEKQVFISYHGGGGNPARSSYPVAEKLHSYLEERGISAFLCKKESDEDFYDKIDFAIKTCRHFILVAKDREMLSEWVKDELKQFDGLRKIGKKPNCFISAYIYGTISEEDLYSFNSLFATKDIAKGEDGFSLIFRGISAKNAVSPTAPAPTHSMPIPEEKNFNTVTLRFLGHDLKRFASMADDELLNHYELLTARLACASPELLPARCDNFIEYLFSKIKSTSGSNLLKVTGNTGTQKSYVLQLLCIYLVSHRDMHGFEPVYLHLGQIRRELVRNSGATAYFERLFMGVKYDMTRTPLFIVDGLLNVVTDDMKVDYVLRSFLDDYYPDSALAVGITNVAADGSSRQNRSRLLTSRFPRDNTINLSRISIYERERCKRYLATYEKYSEAGIDALYDSIYKSGILYLDECIADLYNDCLDGASSCRTITDIFEESLINELGGDDAELSRCAAEVFEFTYGNCEIDYSRPALMRIFNMISKESAYRDCLIAIHYLGMLESYREGDDLSFFQMVLPKDITRFISARIKRNIKYENAVILLSRRYNEMSALGKSEMSFFLGRIAHQNYKETAKSLLERYYAETKDWIKQRVVDQKYNGKPYSQREHKQDLFLLRGLAVSLIYAGDKNTLIEYVHSLIDDDFCNSINRGFHLEYYGDKTYQPNQDSLDYEDNVIVGERTLRLLCDTVESKLESNLSSTSLLLELFTIVSLLQVRIEVEREKILFDIVPFIDRCIELVDDFLVKMPIFDDVILSFFKMARKTLSDYRISNKAYDPALDICNTYLSSKDVKRAGWVQQGIPTPESISEHMHSCWLMALVCLPNRYDDIVGYDKSKILDMLLIHDIAETTLEDIPKYEKKKLVGYEEKENEEMLSIFLKGTYTGIDSMDKYVSAWQQWYEMKSENAKIAKDIDTIQAIYQFLEYNERFPEKFSEERKINWLREIYEVKTKVGEGIAKRLILENPRFSDFIAEYRHRF